MSDLSTWHVTHGAGGKPEESCIMVRASWQHAVDNGYAHLLPIVSLLSDHPCWVNSTVNEVAILCNDAYDGDATGRQKMKHLLYRVMAATRRADTDAEQRINDRLNAWLDAQKGEHPEDDRWTDVMYGDPAGFLDRLLDMWEKAVAEEGEMLNDGADDKVNEKLTDVLKNEEKARDRSVTDEERAVHERRIAKIKERLG